MKATDSPSTENATLPPSAEPLRDEVTQWRGVKATPTAVLCDYIIIGDEMEKALIEETARRRRAEIMLQAMNANYVRDCSPRADLIAALEEAVVWWDDRDPDYDSIGDDPIAPWRAAIAKAKA